MPAQSAKWHTPLPGLIYLLLMQYPLHYCCTYCTYSPTCTPLACSTPPGPEPRDNAVELGSNCPRLGGSKCNRNTALGWHTCCPDRPEPIEVPQTTDTNTQKCCQQSTETTTQGGNQALQQFWTKLLIGTATPAPQWHDNSSHTAAKCHAPYLSGPGKIGEDSWLKQELLREGTSTLHRLHTILLTPADWHRCVPNAPMPTALLLPLQRTLYCYCYTTCTLPYSPDVDAAAAELIRMEVSCNQAQQQQAAQGLNTHQQLSGTGAGLTRLLIGMTTWHGNRSQAAAKWHGSSSTSGLPYHFCQPAQLLTTLLATARWQAATQYGTGTATQNKHQEGTPTAELKTHLLQKTGSATEDTPAAASQGAEGDMIEYHPLLPYTQQKVSGLTEDGRYRFHQGLLPMPSCCLSTQPSTLQYTACTNNQVARQPQNSTCQQVSDLNGTAAAEYQAKQQLNGAAAAAYQALQQFWTKLLIGTATPAPQWHDNSSHTAAKRHTPYLSGPVKIGEDSWLKQDLLREGTSTLHRLHTILLAPADWHSCVPAQMDTSQPPNAPMLIALFLSLQCTPHCYCSTTCTLPYSPDVDAAAAELKPSYIPMEVSCNQAQQQQATQGLDTHQQLSGTGAATAAGNRRETGLTRLLIGINRSQAAAKWHGNSSTSGLPYHFCQPAQLFTTLLATARWQAATQYGTGTATQNKHQEGTLTAELKTHLLQKTGSATPAEWHKAGIPAAGQGAEGDMIEYHPLLPYTQQKTSGQTTTVAAHNTRSQDGTASHSCAQLARAAEPLDAQPPAATLTNFCISLLCFTGIRRTGNSAQPPCTEHHYIVPVPMPPTDSTAHNCCHLLHRLKAERNLRGRQARKITAAWPPARANHAARSHSSLLHTTRAKTTSPHIYAELSGKAETETNNQPKPPANINAPTAHQQEAELLMLQMLLLLLYVCTKICSTLFDCCINYTILSCILFVETATTTIPMRRFLLLTVLHTSPCQENSSCQSRLFCDTVYADEQVPLGESCRGMSLNIHCNTAACCCN